MIDDNTLNATLLESRKEYPAAMLDRETVRALLSAYTRHHASEQASRSPGEVEAVARAIRDADNGLDGDPIAVLLDECPLIDCTTTTREEADEKIMRVCRSAAKAALAAGSAGQVVDENWLMGELQPERAHNCPGLHRQLFDEGIIAAYRKLRPYLRPTPQAAGGREILGLGDDRAGTANELVRLAEQFAAKKGLATTMKVAANLLIRADNALAALQQEPGGGR